MINIFRREQLITDRKIAFIQQLLKVIAKDPQQIGFDHVWVESTRVERVAPTAAAYLAQVPQPFYLSIGFFETHREFPEPDDGPHYCKPPAPLPDTPETRFDMAGFHASAHLLDQGVGTILDALDANGLTENTLLIYTNDHGLAFPGMKCTLTDHGIGIALMIRGPGGFEGHRIIDALVSQVDIFPTICDLLEIERPPWLQGVSLMPLIRGQAEEVREEVYAEVTYHAAYEPQRAVRTKRWKYIRRFDDRTAPVLPNIDDSPSKAVWLGQGLGERAPENEQLFDLVFDPNEADNRAGDPALSAVLDDMRGRLLRWMQSTNDPLLLGPVPLPPGAVANDPDQVSPNQPTIIQGRAPSKSDAPSIPSRL